MRTWGRKRMMGLDDIYSWRMLSEQVGSAWVLTYIELNSIIAPKKKTQMRGTQIQVADHQKQGAKVMQNKIERKKKTKMIVCKFLSFWLPMLQAFAGFVWLTMFIIMKKKFIKINFWASLISHKGLQLENIFPSTFSEFIYENIKVATDLTEHFYRNTKGTA